MARSELPSSGPAASASPHGPLNRPVLPANLAGYSGHPSDAPGLAPAPRQAAKRAALGALGKPRIPTPAAAAAACEGLKR